MEDWMVKALKKAEERISKMTKEEIYEEMFGERDRKRARALELAPAISKLIIDHNIHYCDNEFRYFPERYSTLLEHFSKEDVEIFTGWLDTTDPSIVLFKTEQEELDFPNEQFHTRFGITIDVMWGQGASIRAYKTKVAQPQSNINDEKFILSEN